MFGYIHGNSTTKEFENLYMVLLLNIAKLQIIHNYFAMIDKLFGGIVDTQKSGQFENICTMYMDEP